MVEIINKSRCPLCAEKGRDTAEDNLHTFKSGVMYCVVCEETVGVNNEIKKGVNSKSEREYNDFSNKPINESSGMIIGEYMELKSRGISKKTCEFYGYQINIARVVHIANYYNDAGDIVMQQHRTPDKDFPIYGDRKHRFDLWGLNKFHPNENVFVTITEGQIDTLSIAEIFDCKYPVVSVPSGAGSALESIRRNMHKLSQFKYVVLCFDTDEAGREALSKCLPEFEPGRVRVAKLPRKDANEMLVRGEYVELKDCIYKAVEYIPDPILTGEALIERLDDYIVETHPWPWPIANKLIRPIKSPGIYTIAARPKVGKTRFITEIMRAVIGAGQPMGGIFLEQTIKQVVLEITSSLTGENLTGITGRALTNKEKDLCRRFADNVVIYDHVTHGSDLKDIIKHLPYMVKSLGCKFLIFDNISYSATSAGDSERIGIDIAMKAFKDSTVKYNYTLFNVCHLKRNEGVLEDDVPDVKQIRGSQGIEMYSDYIIGLSRKTNSEDDRERNTLDVHILSDRYTGEDAGKHFKLRYDPKTKMMGDL